MFASSFSLQNRLLAIFTIFEIQFWLFRFGLWVADLSITQIFQENVEESQRGVLGNNKCCGSAPR